MVWFFFHFQKSVKKEMCVVYKNIFYREIEKEIETDSIWLVCLICILCNSYPAAAAWADTLFAPPPSWVFGVSGGTGDPPDSSDGVFDKNRLPPSSETSVIGELYAQHSTPQCVDIVIAFRFVSLNLIDFFLLCLFVCLCWKSQNCKQKRQPKIDTKTKSRVEEKPNRKDVQECSWVFCFKRVESFVSRFIREDKRNR